jgi:hypothetical protein
MRDTMEATASKPPADADSVRKEDITVPIATICSQAGGARNARTHWLKKRGESAPHRTLDFLEIGEPSN